MSSIPGSGSPPVEKGTATFSSNLAWRIPVDRGAWRGYSPPGCKELDTTEGLSYSDEQVEIVHVTFLRTLQPDCYMSKGDGRGMPT